MNVFTFGIIMVYLDYLHLHLSIMSALLLRFSTFSNYLTFSNYSKDSLCKYVNVSMASERVIGKAI